MHVYFLFCLFGLSIKLIYAAVHHERVYINLYLVLKTQTYVILHIFFLTNKKPINSPTCLMMYFPSLIVSELPVFTSILFALVDVLLEKYYTLNISTKKKKPHFFMIRVLFAFGEKYVRKYFSPKAILQYTITIS